MKLTKKQELIYSGKVCAYCGSKTVFGKVKSYNRWTCPDCGSYVGCHKGTDKALGRVADADLRRYKSYAHTYFDKLWRCGDMSRAQAYKWLSNKLGLPPEYTHIGMFSIKTCKRVCAIVGEYQNK